VICVIGQGLALIFGIRDHSEFLSMGIDKRGKSKKEAKKVRILFTSSQFSGRFTFFHESMIHSTATFAYVILFNEVS
jgi:hypothetical protein